MLSCVWWLYSHRVIFYRFEINTNRVGRAFVPLSHHRTCHLWHTAVSRRVISPGTDVPAATPLSLLAGYPDNSSAPLHGFGLAPLSLPRSRLRTFQYFLALLLYVLRFEWLPTPDSALPSGVVRFGGTMASADSLQTVYSAALSRLLTWQRNIIVL